MSEVKRYDLVYNSSFSDSDLEEHPTGDWVPFADYDKLEAENKRLREALENIIKHQRVVAGSLSFAADMTGASAIARAALQESGTGEPQTVTTSRDVQTPSGKEAKSETCRWWLEHRPSGTWMGRCGKEFTFGAEMEPEDAGWVYCPCGKPIEIVSEEDT
jgi:hypothetical protein